MIYSSSLQTEESEPSNSSLTYNCAYSADQITLNSQISKVNSYFWEEGRSIGFGIHKVDSRARSTHKEALPRIQSIRFLDMRKDNNTSIHKEITSIESVYMSITSIQHIHSFHDSAFRHVNSSIFRILYKVDMVWKAWYEWVGTWVEDSDWAMEITR